MTREELLNIIETDHIQCGEAAALARMALAAMDNEPVFTLEVARADYKGQKLGNQFGFITLDAARKLKEGNYQLYAAQPAPVVPECFVRFHDIIKERHYGRMPEEVQNAFDECAAMLATAPQETDHVRK